MSEGRRKRGVVLTDWDHTAMSSPGSASPATRTTAPTSSLSMSIFRT
jgi:hypothetical protein